MALSLTALRTGLPQSPITSFLQPRTLATGLLGTQTSTNVVTDATDALQALGGCELLPSQALRDLCIAGLKVVQTVVGGGGAGQNGGSTTRLEDSLVVKAEEPCGPGKFKLGTQCVSLGDVTPGGLPLFSDAGGELVRGSFGLPAETPTIVGFRANALGEMKPIRQCRTAMVLGTDNLCYSKAILPRRSKHRKHRGDVRPPISVKQMKAMKMIGSLQDTVKELAGDVQLSCKRK